MFKQTKNVCHILNEIFEMLKYKFAAASSNHWIKPTVNMFEINRMQSEFRMRKKNLRIKTFESILPLNQ